jgi:NADPH:quinone reductase-like Zn-dependent oxidoreductase
MKAVTVASQGAEFKISEAPIPEPSDDQMLIKSIYAPVNPVFVVPKSALQPH